MAGLEFVAKGKEGLGSSSGNSISEKSEEADLFSSSFCWVSSS